MGDTIFLKNIEIFEFCTLNILTNQKIYSCSYSKFNGLYYKSDSVFFALFATKNGPAIYYKNAIFPLNENLNIHLKKEDKQRIFYIDEYNIKIIYNESKYMGFDIWSNEIDVDLFYLIEKSYKSKEFYVKYTEN